MELNILTPENKFYQGEIKKLNTETEEGSVGILPGHIKTILFLKDTISNFTDKEGKELKFSNSSGLLKISDNKIIILCDFCKWK